MEEEAIESRKERVQKLGWNSISVCRGEQTNITADVTTKSPVLIIKKTQVHTSRHSMN